MDTNSTPIPPDVQPTAQPPVHPAEPPSSSVVPPQNPTQKSSLSFSSLPMKLTALVFLSVLVLGAFVITQKNKSSESMNDINSKAMTAVSPAAKQTTADTILTKESGTPSPTVAGEIALTLTSPQNGSIVSSPNIIITGKTVPNADVSINDSSVKADATGSFSQSVLLDQGDNIIAVTSVDPNGNYTERQLKVTLNTN